MPKLDGKVAVVTGASSGIGEATAEALAAACDVTDEAQAHGLIQRAEEEFGRVDILVNNAGVMLLSTVGKGLSDEWRRMFDVNTSCSWA